MVTQPHPDKQTSMEEKESQSFDLKWATVQIQEVVEIDHRLDASVHGIEARKLRKDLQRCKWEVVRFERFIEKAFYGGRTKRNYFDENDKNSVGFLGSAEMLSVQPKPVKFLLREDGTAQFSVKQGQVLLSRSGTIGNVSYVNNSLAKYFVSEHAIRISCKEYPGYVYSFLKSKTGRIIVQSNEFGAVISQIEPEQLKHIPIPNPPPILKQKIHDLIEESFKLRDRSNDLMDEAQALLNEALQLPAIQQFQELTEQFDKTAEVLSFSVSVSNLNNRLDSSYHIPIVTVMADHFKETAKEIVTIGDSRISQSVILPSHFKRIYVNEGKGTVLIGGKHLYSLDPTDKKHLATHLYSKKLIDDMLLAENTIIVSAKGTPGKVVITPSHWNGWLISSNLIKIVPASDEVAGFLYCFLSSAFGELLIRRQIYGAVVDIIEPAHVKSVIVPFLKDERSQTEINDKVLEANRKRTEAHELEQEALTVLDERVIYAR